MLTRTILAAVLSLFAATTAPPEAPKIPTLHLSQEAIADLHAIDIVTASATKDCMQGESCAVKWACSVTAGTTEGLMLVDVRDRVFGMVESINSTLYLIDMRSSTLLAANLIKPDRTQAAREPSLEMAIELASGISVARKCLETQVDAIRRGKPSKSI